MKVAIIKYNAGNIRSVDHALKRLGVSAEITDDPDQIQSAERVIFPGVGEAATTMAYLKERELDKLIAGLNTACSGNLPGTAADVQLVGGGRYPMHRNI